jgi:hypothetical protein
LPIRTPSGRDMNAPGGGLVAISMEEATNYWSYKQKVAAGESAAQIVEDANKGWFFGLFGGKDANAPAPNAAPGTPQNMYGISTVDQVKTLNYAQLTEVQKAISAGKLDKSVGGKEFIDAILAEIKRRDDEALQKLEAMRYGFP